MNQPFDLGRFIDAQNGAYEQARNEIEAGEKRSHWMWFIFPQIAGLGHSAMASRYAVASLAEARAYLLHPVLGARLIEITTLLRPYHHRSAEAIFGGIDAIKLRSSLTLFEAAGGPPIFGEVLEQWYDGVPDPATLKLLGHIR